MRIYIKNFNEISPNDLYEILHLRSKIFVVEQKCYYLDVDYKDQNSIHIFMKKEKKIITYLRVILNNNSASIGRVLVRKNYRGESISKILIKKALEYTFNNYSYNKVEIEAQCYLEHYYNNIGFIRASDDYLLDNIPHLMMEITSDTFHKI